MSTRKPDLKMKWLLKSLNKAHVRMERNSIHVAERGTRFYPVEAVKNVLSIRRKLARLLKEVNLSKVALARRRS